jgi:hypothetical protein
MALPRGIEANWQWKIIRTLFCQTPTTNKSTKHEPYVIVSEPHFLQWKCIFIQSTLWYTICLAFTVLINKCWDIFQITLAFPFSKRNSPQTFFLSIFQLIIWWEFQIGTWRGKNCFSFFFVSFFLISPRKQKRLMAKANYKSIFFFYSDN